jgi:hypothetical protein
MTFTYVSPLTADRDKVRFLIQDTDSTAPHMTDEEIQWLIAEWADVYDAAANAADILAGSYAHKADYVKRVGDLHLQETYSKQSERFQALATTLRTNRMRRYVPKWVANSAALQSTNERNVDTYHTDAFVGQMDNPRGTGAGSLNGSN